VEEEASVDDYRRGYLDGYWNTKAEMAGTLAGCVWQHECRRTPLAELEGPPNPDEDEATYWLGYPHGQIHAKTRSPAAEARDRVPPVL
jgi:hypothetical protein